MRKSADLAANLNDSNVGPINQLRVDEFRRLGKMLGVGLLGGAGLGAVNGLVNGLRPAAPEPTVHANFVQIPVPVRKRDKRGPLKLAAAGMAAALHKTAELRALPVAKPDLAARIASGLGAITPKGGQQGAVGAQLFPADAKSMWDMPGMMPLAVLGTGAAALAGYRGVSSLFDRHRNNETDAQLNEARQRYHAALTGGFDAGAKQAGAATALDQLAEKAAHLLSKPLGMYLTAAGGLALGAGAVTYDYAKSHSKAKAVEDALRRRREQMLAESPLPTVAIPTPYRVNDRQQRRALATPFLSGMSPKVATASPAVAAQNTLGALNQRRQAFQQQMLALQNGGKPPTGAAKPAPPTPPTLPSVARNLGAA